jgi:hypothetical protein
MPVLAHFGHWYVSLVYAAPALLLGGGLAISAWRERRRRARAARGAPQASTKPRRIA